MDDSEYYQIDESDDSGVIDKHGQKIMKGQFVYFSRENACLPVGNYRCEGYRYGSAVWSKPGAEFLTCEFTSEFLELLNWKRWKKPAEELQSYIDYRRVA